MGKFQIFPDGRAAGSAPVSGSDFVTKDYLTGSLPGEIWVRGTGSGSARLSGSFNTRASGEYAVVQGHGAAAVGAYTHAEGNYTTARGESSHAEGHMAFASGNVSHAEGFSSTASGYAAHAEGYFAQASGNYSHAEGYYTRTTNTASHAEGGFTTASGLYSHAEGYQTVASGNYSHAEGARTTASGQYSHAEGLSSYAYANYSHAEGWSSKASGTYSHAEGQATETSNNYEHAQGRYNVTASKQIFSIGVGDNQARRKNAISIITGSKPSASVYVYGIGGYNGTNPETGVNDIATVISNLTGSIASASYSSTDKKIYFFNAGGTASAEIDATDFIKDGMVDSVEVSGSYLVLTFNTDAGKEPVSMSLTRIFDPDNFYTKTDVDTLLSTMSVGDVNVIEAIEFNGTASTISGKTASINVELPAAPNQDAENWVTENSASIPTESIWVRSIGNASAILSGSRDVTASGVGAIAHGRLGLHGTDQDPMPVLASGDYSHAEGCGVTSSGPYSHAEGSHSEASGTGSHAEGLFNYAYGNYSHAEGNYSHTYADYSHAEGRSTSARGTYSHAEGCNTVASGNYSHAEGSASVALGQASHAEGWNTRASGDYSHTEGQKTTASAQGAHAEGDYTVATNYYEHAQGKYNATASNQIFSVGVGNAEAKRKNAISIITGSGTVPSASIYIYGIGGYDGTNPTPGTNDLATVINGLTGSQGGITTETDPVYLADSASLKNAATWVGSNSASIIASGALAKTAIQPAATASWDTAASQSHTHSNGSLLNSLTNAKTGSWDGAATWVTANSSSALAVSPASVTASINAAIGGITASHHTHSNKAVLDGITAAKTASWDSAATSATALNSISASLIASGTLAKNVTAITASLVASASVAKTASSSAAAISAKTASWDALVGLPAVTAADNGKILRVVNGAWALVDPVTVYSGQGAPDSALGQDGDIYLQS